MKRNRQIIPIFLFLALLISGMPEDRASAAEKTAFTPADSLRVKSFRASAVTSDGRWIAGTISDRLSRLGTDYKRYGDPSYISPQKMEFVLMNTESGAITSLFPEQVQVQSAAWSEDGKHLAFLKRSGDVFELLIYSMEKNRAKNISLKTQKAVASNSFLVWSHDGRRIFLALRADGWAEKGREMFQEATAGPITVYDSSEPFLKWEKIQNHSILSIPAVVDISTGRVKELLPEGYYSQIRLAENDAFLVYIQAYPLKTSYSREGGQEFELKRFDLIDNRDPQTLIKKTKKRLRLSWNKTNTLFAWEDEGDILLQSADETEARNLTKDKVKPEKEQAPDEDKSDSTEEEKTTKKEKKVRFSLERFSPDGNLLLARTEKGFWIIDHASGDLNMVYTFPAKPEEGGPKIKRPAVQAWSLDGRTVTLSYAAADKWERGFDRLDLQSGSLEVLIRDSNLYRGLQMTEDGETFFYSFSDGDSPEDFYRTGPDFKQTKRLTDLNPWVRDRSLTRSELISYYDVDGKELYGVLYYPVNYEPGKKYPLVCELYEGFFDNGFNTNMNIITGRGWFGLRPSVNLEIGYPGESWIKGVTSAVNKLIEKGMVDAKKVGIHGTSYGGYAVSLLITQTDRFAAAVNISGKVNIISFLGDSPRIGTRNYAAAEVGQDRIGKTLWEQPLKYIYHSAVMFADRVKTPHLLITGEGDWNVPAGNTREMYYALRRLGKECVWVNYANDGHGLGSAENEAIYQDKWDRILDWYTVHFDNADKKKDQNRP